MAKEPAKVEPVAHPGRVVGLYVFLFAAGIFSTAAVNLWRLGAGLAALLSFGAVLAAALCISWGAEAAQFHVSQGLAVAAVALLQVMPEFMVEAVIAWHGQIDLMFANATGSNRLLIGLGWPFIYFVAEISSRLRYGKRSGAIVLRRENITEVVALAVSSGYYLVILAKGTLAWYDTLVLGTLFAAYLWALGKLPAEDVSEADELLAPSRYIVTRPRKQTRYLWMGLIFAFGAGVMTLVADPFVQTLQEVAVSLGISVFAFVQWVAPFLSEFPEKVTAFYWSRTVRMAPMALLNMISSTVSQFTALVAMIPAVYSASPASPAALASVPMDASHRTEIFLSWAMTLYGVACLLKLRFTAANALWLFGLWVVQFVYRGDLPVAVPFIGASAHGVVAWVLVILAGVEVVRTWPEIQLRPSMAYAWSLMTAENRSPRAPA